MKRMILVGVLIGGMLLAQAATALDKLSVGIGGNYRNDLNLYGARLGLQWDWSGGPLWTHGDWQLGGYWEASYNYFHHFSANTAHNRHLHIWAISPVFVLRSPAWRTWQPYVELAIGAAYFSDKNIAGRVTGSHYQFEDRAAFGVRFGPQQQYDLNLRVLHYSNADLADPNPGYDLLMLNLTLPAPF
jgi:lipid A 3-O-deacylase